MVVAVGSLAIEDVLNSRVCLAEGRRQISFGQRESHEVRRFNQLYKPARVHAQLAAKNDRGVTSETVRKLCYDGQLAKAVTALDVLVNTERFISRSLFYTVLKQCMVKKDLVLGSRVHDFTVKKGYESDTFLCNHILRMYASHGRLQDAMDVFEGVARPDAFMWSSVISAHVKRGEDKTAIQLYYRMRESNVKPDGHVFVAALQACARGSDLKAGQQVHADVLATGVEPDLFVGNSLLNMYTKCGSLEEAEEVFATLGQKDVITWNAMIAGYSKRGMGPEALRLYTAMPKAGISGPNSVTFVCLLQACASVGTPALESGRQLHARIKEGGHEADLFVANSLVNMYAKCGSLEDAQRVFDGLGYKDVVTWTALIAGYSQQGMGQQAICLYSAMQEEGIAVPNPLTVVFLLQACVSLGSLALETGKQLHSQIRERGLEADVFVASSLVNMYVKCGSLEEAQGVFDGLGQKDVVTWNAMIAGYSHQGVGREALRLYNAMHDEGIVVPNSVTFVCLLQACASVGTPAFEKGKQLHAEINERGHQTDVMVANSLVHMYVKCGSLEHAQIIFDGLGKRNVVTWTAMIAGYSQRGMGQEALRLYSAMQDEGISVPDSITFVYLLQACASAGTLALETGKEIHKQIAEQGDAADVFITSSLVNMYAKCGSLEDAQRVFDGLGEKSLVTWTALLAGYSQQGMGQEALLLYRAMQEEGKVELDSVTYVCLLQACASVGAPALEKGKQLHTQIREQGYEDDVFVASSLVNMYAKCGSLKDAVRVFERHGEANVVMWNAMIAGYSHQGMGQEALRLYRAMQGEGIVKPDVLTFVCLLQACANVSALNLGKQLHAQILEQGLEADLQVIVSLINMYGKSGSMGDAQRVFDTLPERDVPTWNSLIAGYSSQGDSEVVFALVERMEKDGIWPDCITFVSVLTVCSHAGLLKKGREYFELMSRYYDITPTVEHCTCMVDLLGRAGQLDEALRLVRMMPTQPNAAVWHTLLGGCGKWSDVEVGRQAFNEAVKLDKKDAAAYVLISSVYTGVQMWEQAHTIQVRRKIARAWKQPGQSWWTDENGLVHSFQVGDRQRPQSQAGLKQILCKLEEQR